MSRYRLLVDWEVIEQINQMPRRKREFFRDSFLRIAESPERHSDYRESNPNGRAIDVHLCQGFAIRYWIDFSDRHVKVLSLEPADVA